MSVKQKQSFLREVFSKRIKILNNYQTKKTMVLIIVKLINDTQVFICQVLSTCLVLCWVSNIVLSFHVLTYSLELQQWILMTILEGSQCSICYTYRYAPARVAHYGYLGHRMLDWNSKFGNVRLVQLWVVVAVTVIQKTTFTCNHKVKLCLEIQILIRLEV